MTWKTLTDIEMVLVGRVLGIEDERVEFEDISIAVRVGPVPVPNWNLELVQRLQRPVTIMHPVVVRWHRVVS